MGIYGLLPLLASITEKKHLSEYSGLRAAIDAYVWLHRGAYSCSFELCQNLPTKKYLEYCMRMIAMLESHNIKLTLVFDGGSLPSKKDEENSRKQRRREALKKANEFLQSGNKRKAYELFQRAVDVTPNMALGLIEHLRSKNIDYIVAPYEADAQLTFLSINNMVDFVISEDSDLVPYGCHRILYKLDKKGWGHEILLERIPFVKELDLSNFSLEMVRYMCILSGCDYLESISGMGLKKAHALLVKYGKIVKVLEVLVSTKSKVPSDYEESFRRADLTFQHQIVYDPRIKKAVPLRVVPKEISMDNIWFVGKLLADDLVCRIARGECNPHTRNPFSDEQKTTSRIRTNSVTVNDIRCKIRNTYSDDDVQGWIKTRCDDQKDLHRSSKKSILSFFAPDTAEHSRPPQRTKFQSSSQPSSDVRVPVIASSRFFPNLPCEEISDEQCCKLMQQIEEQMLAVRKPADEKPAIFALHRKRQTNAMFETPDNLQLKLQDSDEDQIDLASTESICDYFSSQKWMEIKRSSNEKLSNFLQKYDLSAQTVAGQQRDASGDCLVEQKKPSTDQKAVLTCNVNLPSTQSVGEKLQLTAVEKNSFEKFCKFPDSEEAGDAQQDTNKQITLQQLVSQYEFHDCEKIEVSLFEQTM